MSCGPFNGTFDELANIFDILLKTSSTKSKYILTIFLLYEYVVPNLVFAKNPLFFNS